MATGHTRHGGGFSDAALDRCLEHKGVRALLAKPFKVNKEYDLPYLAGYSKDARTIYVDRHLPGVIKIGHKMVNVLPFLLTHERTEKAVMTAMGYLYSAAHTIATMAEHRKVREYGINPREYEKALKPYIKADEHERVTKIPSDLDLAPYEEESDPESRAILRHIREVLGK